MNTQKTLVSYPPPSAIRAFASAVLTSLLLLSVASAPFAPSICAATVVGNGETINITTPAEAVSLGVNPLSQLGFAGSGTINIGTGLDIAFDSAGGTDNRLALDAGKSATFLLGDNSTATFTSNTAAIGGAAIYAAPGSTLALTAGANSWYVFSNNRNTSTQNGAAISGSLANIIIASATFANNYSAGGDGAIYNYSGTLTLLNSVVVSNTSVAAGGAIGNRNVNAVTSATNVYFANNTATGNGGAIFNNNSGAGSLTITSATFACNSALGIGNNGGAIANQAVVPVTITDALFMSNTAAGNGGAYFSSNAATGVSYNFIDVIFRDNIALGNYGGAVAINGNNSVTTFTNASFYNNSSGTMGGAIGVLNSTNAILNLSVTTGTSRFAGNTDQSGRNAINHTNTNNNSPNSAINIDTTAGALLDMLDPIASNMTSGNANPNYLTINKTGAGSWNLGGATKLSTTGNPNGFLFNVKAGTLHLHRSGTLHDNYTGKDYAVDTASISMRTTAAGTGTMTFTLAGGATPGAGARLSIGGGNTISITKADNTTPYGAITLGTNSILTYDLASYDAIAGTQQVAGAGTALLSLTAATLNVNANATTFNFGLDFTTVATGTYNLLYGNTGIFATNTTNLTFLGGITGLDAYTVTNGITNGCLWISILTPAFSNNVLLWTGASSSWLGSNWLATATLTSATFTPGDIVNLANLPAGRTPAINVDATDATLAGIYISGTENYTITGNAITTSATVPGGTFTGSAAATGKLILGATAAPGASGIDYTPAYTGTLVLGNASNNFTGGIEIRSGALSGNDKTLGTGSTGITIAATGTLIFDQTTTGTYAAPILGSGALIKNNTAALTLAAPGTTFAGATDIKAGALYLAAATKLGGSIRVRANAILGGSGTAAGNLILDPNATLQVGGPAPISILGDLTLDGAIIDYLALGNQLTIGGAINLLSLSTLNVSATTGGTYALINLASGFAASSITQSALDAGTLFNVTYNNILLDPSAYDLALNPGGTSLSIIFFGIPPTILASHVLTWSGTTDNAWHNSPNWISSGSTVRYVQNSAVNLSGAGGGLITLAETATTAGLYVSGTASYALAGAPIIATSTGAPSDIAGTPAASGKLVLGQIAAATGTRTTTAFTGTLDLTGITGANNFTGGVDIYGGALRIANAGQLGTTLSRLAILGSATLQAAANSSITFDGSTYAAAENRLVLTAGHTLAIALENSATMTFGNNYASAAGGAINATTATFTLAAAPDARYMFADNTTDQTGGAINATTSTLLIANATFIRNYSAGNDGALSNNTGALTLLNTTFTSNTATVGQGGALGNRNATALLTATNVYFANNTAGGANNGGAFFNNGNAIITSATFASNNAGNNGGAIGNHSVSGTLAITNALIASNTAGSNGGGYFASTQATGTANTIANSTFVANTALGNYGGAIGINGNNSIHTLADVSFYDNTSGTLGGAIGIYNANNAKLTIVATGTSRFAGNTDASGPNAINYSNLNNGQTGGAITINTTAADSVLDMLDPVTANMSSANANPNILTITKEGAGTWKLGGSTNLSTTTNGRYNININAGTLYLYRAGKIVHDAYMNKDYVTRAGSIAMTGVTTGAFVLAAPATLSIGGGNTISAPTINLAANSTIALDLSDAFTLPGALLTLNATTFTTAGWAQNLSLLNLDTLDATPGDIVNLITLGGAGATSSLFTTAAFNNHTSITGLLDNYAIQAAPDGLSLFLLYTGTGAAISNNVLTWTAAAATTSWRGPNWDATISGTTTTVKFTKGDIINLAGLPAPVTSATINVDTIVTTTIAGMYVSGSTNYTFSASGAPIVADPTAGSLAGSAAATGKLILGASAAPDASAIDYTTTFTGTLILANTQGGSNNFTGGIEINTGALLGNAASLGSGTVGITIAAPATLTFDQAANATYAAPITGAGTLAKTNTGTLTLAADNAAFTGATQVAAGSLLLGGSTSALGGSVHVDTGAAFGGLGSAGNVTLDTGATLQVGLPSAADESTLQSLNLSSLALSDGATIDYADIAAGNRLLAGALTHTGTLTINIDSFQSGTFDLGNIGALASAATITIAGAAQFADARQQAILITSGSDLLLTAAGDISRVMIWTGSANNTWALTGANWANSATNVFGNGDTIIFNDTAPGAAHNINITPGGVTVSDMMVDGTSNYTFTGGGITADAASVFDGSEITAADATGRLTKQNTGTLTLANGENNFLGGIALEGGALVLAGITHAGGTVAANAATTLQMTGATLVAENLQFADSSTLAGAGSITAATTLNGTVAAGIAGGGTLAFAGTVDGTGGFHKTGAGELRFSNAILTNTGTTQIDQGTLRITATTPATAPLTTQAILLNGGGTLALGAFTTSTTGRADSATTAHWTGLAITQGANPAAAAITGNDDMISITDSGTFAPALLHGLHIAVNPGAGNTIVLSNTANNFGGIVRVDSGTLQVTNARQIGNGAGNTTKIALAGGALQISASNFALTSPNRDVELRAPENTIGIDDGINATLYRIRMIPATIAAANLTKVGSGTLTLNAAYQATGLTVAEGRFVTRANNGTPANSGTVSIHAGAVFEINSTNPVGAAMAGLVGAQAFYPSSTTSNPYIGSGTLEVTAGNIAFAAHDSDIAHVNIRGPNTAIAISSPAPSANFSRTGTITVDQGRLILATGNQNLGNVVLQNGATLGFLMSGTLNPAGNLVTGMPNRTATLASLTATGAGTPTLWFNTNIALGYANHLTVTAPVSGTFALGIKNYTTNSASLSAQVTSRIELLRAPAGFAPDSDIILPFSQIDIGLYKYTLSGVTDGGTYSVVITGTGAMSNPVALINTMAASQSASWFSEMDSVTQRLGELHFEKRGDKSGPGAWMRGYGERLDFNGKLTGADFRETRYAFEAGFDYKCGTGTLNAYIGAFAGHGQTRRDHTAAGDGTSDSTFSGLYLTLATKAGWYLDAVGKYDNFKNNFTAGAPAGDSSTASYNNSAIGGSLEIGKYCDIGGGWFVQPQLQGACASIGGASYGTSAGMIVDQRAATVMRARAGFLFGYAIETENHGALNLYLKGYYGSQWVYDGQLCITAPGGQTARYSSVITGEALEGGAGIAWLFTPRTQLYFDYSTTQADDYIKPWGFNLGIRYNW